jgi:hypothetical protein
MRKRFLVALVPLLVACGSYDYNRAALVPRATPRMNSGHPLAGKAQLTVGASSLAHLGTPGAGDPDAGVEIPGTQLFASLRAKFRDDSSIGLLYENGLDEGAEPLDRTQPPVEGRNVQGYGLASDYSVGLLDPRFRIGLGTDVMFWAVPYVEYLTCAADQECFPYSIQNEGTEIVMTFTGSVAPSFRLSDEVTLFAGLTLRQHPTLKQKGMAQASLDGPRITSPFNFLLSGGMELAIGGGRVLATAIAYWDVSREPARYGPGVAVLLSIPFGKRDPAPAAPAGPPPPPAP